MGDKTGTNADPIAVSGKGIPTGLISIPLRYMHTAVEMIDTEDIENSARLLAAYIRDHCENHGREDPAPTCCDENNT